MRKSQEPFSVIVACDTVIEFGGEIIGKPTSPEDAVETLKRLRNNTHNVYTGMALYYHDADQYEEIIEKTIVHFGDIPDGVIQDYVDSGAPLRHWLLAEDMLKDGVGSILVQNPFYGDRKPANQFRSSLLHVSDLFVMGAALNAECNHLFSWTEKLGYGPFGVSGVSMGGFMAQLVGASAQRPVTIVPILSWTTASPSYTEGAISPAVNYPLLQAQLKDPHYVDKIARIPDQNWLDKMHEMTAKNGDIEAKNMMRILMDYFTSL
uniref:Uncharacterized protein n=1 Tax=Caenorhabditis japonica TaxID=281687 RepID=A0A8R1HS80_CAEJA